MQPWEVYYALQKLYLAQLTMSMIEFRTLEHELIMQLKKK